MAITKTTLSGAVAALDTTIGVASATGITVGTGPTGAGLVYLYVGSEVMIPNKVNGTAIGVIRGQLGTAQVAHDNTEPVIIGLPADFPNFVPQQGVTTEKNNRFKGVNGPIASANTIVAPGAYFHVTGTTLIKTITLPTNFVEGSIRIIFDGVDTWDATGNIAVAGTNTTAASFVDFYYDAGTTKWYPSRVA